MSEGMSPRMHLSAHQGPPSPPPHIFLTFTGHLKGSTLHHLPCTVGSEGPAPHNNSSSILGLVQDSSNPHPSPESPPGCPHLAPNNFHKILFLLLWRQDKTDIVILEEEAEKMNSGPQCPGFKSQLRQLPSQAWWLSLRATATHAAPREGQPDLPSHTVCPGPSFAPARTLGCREVLRTLTHGPCTKSPDPGACGGRRDNRSCQ